jgi:hypothetical protein
MALARRTVHAAVHGTRHEIRGKKLKGPPTADMLPFDVPKNKEAHGRRVSANVSPVPHLCVDLGSSGVVFVCKNSH